MSTLSPGRPRMIPLHRIRTKATTPTIIVTSPGFQVRRCPRAMIQERMNGAVHASASSQSSVENTCQALAPSPPLAPPITECGLSSLVVNQGSQSAPNSTTAHPIPKNSPGVSREKSR
jgi:hypothetical protein